VHKIKHYLSATGIFLLGILLMPCQAQAQLPDPCTMLLCVSGYTNIPQHSGGPLCAPVTNAYWAIADRPGGGFDPFTSCAWRMGYLESCPAAATNAVALGLIQAGYCLQYYLPPPLLP
jgi:hypothetical protein